MEMLKCIHRGVNSVFIDVLQCVFIEVLQCIFIEMLQCIHRGAMVYS